MALHSGMPLLSVPARVFTESQRRIGKYSGSRITKYKKPFVGGIHKRIQKPFTPRNDDDYAAEGESLYPEIPGEYPPGEWGKMDVDRAWRFHARSKELLNIGSLRERLYNLIQVKVPWTEKIESKEKMKHWLVEPSQERPYFFPFLQYCTKTRLNLALPTNTLRPNSTINHTRLKERIHRKACLLEAQGATAQTRVAAIVEAISSELLAQDRVEHLVEGQMEENVTYQAGWRRCGFQEDDIENEIPKTKLWEKEKGWYKPHGGYDHLDPGIINFQGCATPFLSLRSQFPIKEESSAPIPQIAIASTDGGVPSFIHDWVVHDENSIPLYAYHPSLYGLKSFIEPPSLDAGYRLQPVYSKDWIEAHRDKFWTEKVSTWNAISDRGKIRRVFKHHHEVYHPGVESDPRGFPHTAFVLPATEEGIETLGYDDIDPMQLQQWDAERMLTTLFTWNVASAHYQGFCSYLDLTYPIVSQGVITDGRSWQFCILQTDTIEIWRDDDAFKKGSTMWMSRKLSMGEDSDLVINILTNLLSRETKRDMSQTELQPYITKSDEIVEVVKPKYDFEMKVL